MNDLEIANILKARVGECVRSGERVLLIVPDTTRTAPMARLLGLLCPVLRDAGAQVTILIALGTHPPMPDDALREHLGAAPYDCGFRIINHAWHRPEMVVSIGELSADEVRQLTGGLMAERVDLRLNREVASADRMILLHPVYPHELVGFSGGSKSLFPGISGPEMIDIVHWLGALCTSSAVIGRIDTPSRRVLNAAARKVPVPMHGLSFVYHRGEIVAFEAGELQPAWERAARISQQVHTIRTARRFRKVLACCPPMYPDLWTGSKCVYKCAPVVEDGGELVVYAPHVRCFSEVHNDIVLALGFHVRDYFLAHFDKYAHLPRAVMAYCTIVKGDGTYENGVEHPRMRVSFASQIPPEACEAAGIGYADPAGLDIERWADREEEGILLVRKAGEMLYQFGGQT